MIAGELEQVQKFEQKQKQEQEQKQKQKYEHEYEYEYEREHEYEQRQKHVDGDGVEGVSEGGVRDRLCRSLASLEARIEGVCASLGAAGRRVPGVSRGGRGLGIGRPCQRFVLGIALIVLSASPAGAQPPAAGPLGPEIRTGDAVPRDVRELYDRGLAFLVETQTEGGNWNSNHRGAGVTGMAVMCFLASGEDPNFGRYAGNIRRALRSMISQQDPSTGYFGGSMYHHGFAMLALAEAYGAVDDRNLWGPEVGNPLSIGESLELAVRSAVTSQKSNPLSAWRYNPSGNDADTSVSGAVLMGLLAARNAGIEVPDESVDKAIDYFVKMTSPSGQVAYSGGMGGFNESLARISIAALVYSIARREDLPQFKATLKYLKGRLQSGSSGHGGQEYQHYYQAQALFQGDYAAWRKWNKNLIRQLKRTQQANGSFQGQQGTYVSTTLSLLAVAVNYRFLPIYER